MAQSNDKSEPYRFHGVALKPVKGGKEKQYIGDCPLCGKQDHFFVTGETGQFQCKVCNEAGNIYSFFQKIHAEALKRTKRPDWERLASLRGLPWSAFRDHQFAYDKRTKNWLLPLHNVKGSLANLLVFNPPKINKLMGSPHCEQHLYAGHKINPEGPIYVCEGQWDAVALEHLFLKARLDASQFSVVAVPGAGTLKKEWLPVFKNREVFLCYDHGTAGSSGMEKAVVLLGENSKTRIIRWPSNLPDGYDVNDFVKSRLAKAKDGYKAFHQLFPADDPVSRKKGPRLIRNTFESVVRDFKKTIHIDKAWERALAVCMATVISGQLGDDPLWVFLVGPPGSGKTLLVESFLNCPQRAIYMSKITRQSLVSGYRGEEDYGILDKLRSLCLIVKDYTAIATLPLAVQEELYGILRDVYDGHCVVPFGNQEPKVFNGCYFSMIASVTDIIRAHNRAALGERFLKIELLDLINHDPERHIRTAIRSSTSPIENWSKNEEFLRNSVEAFMSRPFDEHKLPQLPLWMEDIIVNLGQLCAYLRAVVAKSGGELSYRPRPEIATRFSKQLTKLARCLCWVYGKSKIDKDICRIVQTIAIETILSWDVEIVHALFQAGDKGCLLPDLGALMQLSHTGITRRLEDLQHLQIVYRSKETKKDGRGQRRFIWYLSPKIAEFWAGAKLEYVPPPIVKHKERPGYTPKRKPKPTKTKTKLPRHQPADRKLPTRTKPSLPKKPNAKLHPSQSRKNGRKKATA